MAKILMIDDDEDVLLAARILLKNYFTNVVTEKNPEKLMHLLSQDKFDVILLDMNYRSRINSGNEGLYWLRSILEKDKDAIVILITAFGDIELAVRAIKDGATDFVLKPWHNEKLVATIHSAMELSKSRKEVIDLKKKNQNLAELSGNVPDFIGVSPAMKKIFATIEKVAPTDANVLILGENGTGKELVARALHRQSKRSKEAFVSVDLGSLSESLFESELFGHVKGSFTDAREDRAGRFEVANKGSLFLDEIGNLSMGMQAKLLTALQTRQVTRIGSNISASADIRLICATNMKLYDMVDDSQFRQDLLYRINTVEITIPPLRERPEDIEPIAKHYFGLYTRKYMKTEMQLSKEAIQKLKFYSWPGNVRELQHSMERAVILAEGQVLRDEDFMLATQSKKALEMMPMTLNLEDTEKRLIKQAIEKHHGNISRAAGELGLTRAALYRRMEKFGL